MLTFSGGLRESYRIPVAVLVAGVGIYLLGTVSDLTLFTRVAIVAAPAAVAVSCIWTSKRYDHSRVFGRSYILLGAGYAVAFAGEMVYFYYVDHLRLAAYAALGDALILSSYPFMMAHIAINVRYFAERLGAVQKLLLAGVPGAILAGYSVVLTVASPDDPAGFYYYLPFVFASAALLGLASVAFSMFRQTVLISAWFVLLIGITLGTVGDVLYNYASTLGVYSFGDFSNVLWIASQVIIVYALYKHRKSI